MGRVTASQVQVCQKYAPLGGLSTLEAYLFNFRLSSGLCTLCATVTLTPTLSLMLMLVRTNKNARYSHEHVKLKITLYVTPEELSAPDSYSRGERRVHACLSVCGTVLLGGSSPASSASVGAGGSMRIGTV
eukprot:scaffold8514_cov125-Isochrysis_galbana.AAC.1